jgi:sugar phosphate isomerase/epimerase
MNLPSDRERDLRVRRRLAGVMREEEQHARRRTLKVRLEDEHGREVVVSLSDLVDLLQEERLSR